VTTISASSQPHPIRMSRLRRTIGRRMRESVMTKPAVTLHTTARADLLLSVVEVGRRLGERVSVTSLVGHLTARTLQAHPGLNGHIADEHTTSFEHVHLGIAVDTAGGLIVPVVRDAHLKNPNEIGTELARLAESARAGSLTPTDVLDATFTLSTLGAFGIEQFTPIINPPQIGVLGVGTIKSVVARVDGEWVEQPHLHLSLTFDHAAIDGAPAARFLADLVERISGLTSSSKETP
jgi:pyruvate dehydrogenase E2 component (dihydrolipoamide acetyltransferase)